MRTPLLSLLMLFNLNAEALKLKELTLDKTIYKDVTIEKVSELEAKITHKDGLKRVRFTLLPEDIASKLGYDKTKADTVINAYISDKNKRLEIRNYHAISGTIIQVLSDGVLVEGIELWDRIYDDKRRSSYWGRGNYKFDGGSGTMIMFLKGYNGPTDVIDGKGIGCLVRPNGVYSYYTVLGSQKTVGSYIWKQRAADLE